MNPKEVSTNSAELYDVHTHVGLDAACMLRGWWPYACMGRQLLDQMDHSGIRRAVCFPFTVPCAFDAAAFADRLESTLLPGRFPYDRENELLLAECARFGGGRLLPFAMFDPARRVAEQLKALRHLAGGLHGLKTQTTVLQSDIRLLLTESRSLMAFAMERDLPVVVHTAVNPADRWAQASDCLDVAEAFPGVRFNLAHSLRFDEPLLRRAAQLTNVWVDCSAHLIHCQLAREDSPAVAAQGRRVKADYHDPAAVMMAVEELLGGKYLWGSDNPYMSWCDDDMAYVRSYAEEAAILHSLPPDMRMRMANTGPRAWLGKRAKG